MIEGWKSLPHRLLSDGSVFFLREVPEDMPGWYGDGNIYKKILPACIHRGYITVEVKCCHGDGKVLSCDGKQINLNECHDCTRLKA